jgi:hypothetical protein
MVGVEGGKDSVGKEGGREGRRPEAGRVRVVRDTLSKAAMWLVCSRSSVTEQ